MFSDLEPFLNQLQGYLQTMDEKSVLLQKLLEQRQKYVTQAETLETAAGEVVVSGKGK